MCNQCERLKTMAQNLLEYYIQVEKVNHARAWKFIVEDVAQMETPKEMPIDMQILEENAP